MILRLSEKLNTKITAGTSRALPLDDNTYADWSATLFVADRTQYILLTNTNSLYSVVMYAREITNDGRFIERALSNIRAFMEADDQEFVYLKFVAPSSASVHFAKALNRSVTGSMNDLIMHAKVWLTEGELSPLDIGFKLNQIPFSSLKYLSPRDAFKSMSSESGMSSNKKHSSERPLPRTPAEWLTEIQMAIADARECEPISRAIGEPITDSNLFHLAPLVCLKFRGRKLTGREADRVTKVALANYVANSYPEGNDYGLEQRPLMAFALCYVTAHLALDLLDEQKAEAILNYCEERVEA
jgi:hypothetical protein